MELRPMNLNDHNQKAGIRDPGGDVYKGAWWSKEVSEQRDELNWRS